MSHVEFAAVATAKATVDLEAAAEGAAKGCSDAAVARHYLANVLESVKVAGLDTHPERETADRIAARAMLVLTACNNLLSTRTHLEHLMSDARFVTEAEERRPHETRTLRIVRVLDVSVAFIWAVLLLWLAHELTWRRRSIGDARQIVLASLSVLAFVYFLGALCDFGQCHLQAGGIGSQCNGMACGCVACLCLLCTIIGQWNPRFFAFAALTLQGVHRMHWASRQLLESNWRVFFGTMAICFVSFPLFVYAQELATAAQKLCVQRRYQESEKHVDEKDKPAEKPEAGIPLVATLAVNSLLARPRQETAHLSAVGRISPQVRALCEEAPERLKEDNSKVGIGSESTSLALSFDSDASASAALGNTVPALHVRLRTAQRKRSRRDEQNELLASLDSLLPKGARRAGFKSAGNRSAGVLGRSLFNILTDTIHHLRVRAQNKGNLDGVTTRNETLVALGLSYRDVLLSSKTLVAMEVDLQGDKLVVRTLGLGAQDWFANAPGEVCKGTLLRELVHADNWSSLQQLEDALSAARATGSVLSSNRNMVLDVQLGHFKTSKYVYDHIDSTKPCPLRSMKTVEYVRTKVKVICSTQELKESAQKAKMDTPSIATPKSAAKHPHAILLFDTPESWQWVPLKPMTNNATGQTGSATPSEPANMLGHWVHVEDENASSLPTLEQLIGSAHEFMGVFKLDKREVVGVQDGVDTACVKKAGLEWISSILFDPMTLLDIRDQEVMENVVTSFEQMTRSRSGLPSSLASSTDGAQKIVTDCIELHSGIASTSLVDILTLSYRLKLPHALGGYESAWRPLYRHILNARAVSEFSFDLLLCDASAARCAAKMQSLHMDCAHISRGDRTDICYLGTCRRT
jgi:hypothetical protein